MRFIGNRIGFCAGATDKRIGFSSGSYSPLGLVLAFGITVFGSITLRVSTALALGSIFGAVSARALGSDEPDRSGDVAT